MMSIRRNRTLSEADLAALADGSLPANRRIPVERAVSESPRLQAALAAQRRTLSAIGQVGDEPAPPALRARLALAHPPRRPAARLRPAGMMAASLAAVLVAVVVVVITAGSPSAHASVLEASLVATGPPQADVGSPRGHSGVLPGVREAGLTYPYLRDRFGYRTIGARHDRFAGRTATTVLYTHGGSRVAYEIVSGPPLKLGGAAGKVVRGEIVFHMLRTSHGPVVTWVRHGHTCILVGRGTTVPVMLRLAYWHDGGRVPY